jgi:hypothetical protein
MIVSASRRTDIPAFYSPWFVNRLRKGFVYVRNPFNNKQISCVSLSPSHIECIVFWTKNPSNIISYLKEIQSLGYDYYFQFTLTGYGKKIEKKVPDKKYLIDVFKELSDMIGREKIIWRYDPIFLSDDMSDKYHIENFVSIAGELTGYTEKCIFSFLDMYKKCERNMKSVPVKVITKQKQFDLAKKLKNIAQDHFLQLDTCSEKIELDHFGIHHGKCIDDTLISKIIGQGLSMKKDPAQRNACGCVSSIDIGAYNTCAHNCLYCYANDSDDAVEKNVRGHDVNSPLLTGQPDGNEKIMERKITSFLDRQLTLFE